MKPLKIEYFEMRKLEIATTIYCILWGIWLLLPWDSFSTSAVFNKMSEVAPEWVWGAIVFTSGVTQIVLAFHNKLTLSIISSGVAMFTFITLFIFTILSNYRATACITYATFSISSVMSYMQLLIIKKSQNGKRA